MPSPEQYNFLKRNHICVACGKEPASNTLRCEKCRMKQVERSKRDYELKKKNKRCLSCGGERFKNYTKCVKCLNTVKLWNRKRTLNSPWRPKGPGRKPADPTV